MSAVPNMVSSGAVLCVTVALLCFTLVPGSFGCDQPDVPSTFTTFMFEASPSIRSKLRWIGSYLQQTSRDSALAELGEDYLDNAEIQKLADISINFYTTKKLSFKGIGGSCLVPEACSFFKCGCGSGRRRKLLQCVPHFQDCGQGNPATAKPPAPGSQPVRTGSNIVVTLCTASKCIYFEIDPTFETKIVSAFQQLCPDVLTFSGTGGGVDTFATASASSHTGSGTP